MHKFLSLSIRFQHLKNNKDFGICLAMSEYTCCLYRGTWYIRDKIQLIEA